MTCEFRLWNISTPAGAVTQRPVVVRCSRSSKCCRGLKAALPALLPRETLWLSRDCVNKYGCYLTPHRSSACGEYGRVRACVSLSSSPLKRDWKSLFKYCKGFLLKTNKQTKNKRKETFWHPPSQWGGITPKMSALNIPSVSENALLK